MTGPVGQGRGRSVGQPAPSAVEPAVLVVSANTGRALVLATALEKQGAFPETADPSSVADAVVAATPDVVVLYAEDVIPEVVHGIAHAARALPVIMLGGQAAQREIRLRAFPVGTAVALSDAGGTPAVAARVVDLAREVVRAGGKLPAATAAAEPHPLEAARETVKQRRARRQPTLSTTRAALSPSAPQAEVGPPSSQRPPKKADTPRPASVRPLSLQTPTPAAARARPVAGGSTPPPPPAVAPSVPPPPAAAPRPRNPLSVPPPLPPPASTARAPATIPPAPPPPSMPPPAPPVLPPPSLPPPARPPPKPVTGHRSSPPPKPVTGHRSSPPPKPGAFPPVPAFPSVPPPPVLPPTTSPPQAGVPQSQPPSPLQRPPPHPQAAPSRAAALELARKNLQAAAAALGAPPSAPQTSPVMPAPAPAEKPPSFVDLTEEVESEPIPVSPDWDEGTPLPRPVPAVVDRTADLAAIAAEASALAHRKKSRKGWLALAVLLVGAGGAAAAVKFGKLDLSFASPDVTVRASSAIAPAQSRARDHAKALVDAALARAAEKAKNTITETQKDAPTCEELLRDGTARDGASKASGDAVALEALRLTMTRDRKGALKVYCAGILEHPDHAGLRIGQIEVLLALGDAKAAAARAKEALEVLPDNSTLTYLLGDALACQADWNEARQLWLKAGHAAPDNHEAVAREASRHINAARDAFLKRKFADAKRFFLRAALLGDQSLEAAAGMAQTLLLLRDPKPAAQWAERAAKLQPTAAEPYVMMGKAYDALGDVAAAKEAWHKALRLNRSHPEARRRVYQLDQQETK